MATYCAYHLNFRSPLHLGRRGIELKKTEVSIPADTLFSAICQTWRTFFGEESLVQDFLEGYKNAEPFLLTSAFPFAGSLQFFPKPLRQIEVSDDNRKGSKRVCFVSEKRFNQIVGGEQIKFNQEDLINNGKIWIHPDERSAINFLGDSENSIVWQTDVKPRVTVDRRSSASAIWHVGSVKFNPNCGLWFAAKYDEAKTQARVETLLRVLGDTGIGGERNAGYGLFDLEVGCFAYVQDDMNSEGAQFVTLSPICPRDAEELGALIQGNVSYTLSERSGWISSPDASHLRRNRVWMFAEGSVLAGRDKQVGRLIDLRPDLCPHPVWRYGYAWPIKVR